MNSSKMAQKLACWMNWTAEYGGKFWYPWESFFIWYLRKHVGNSPVRLEKFRQIVNKFFFAHIAHVFAHYYHHFELQPRRVAIARTVLLVSWQTAGTGGGNGGVEGGESVHQSILDAVCRLVPSGKWRCRRPLHFCCSECSPICARCRARCQRLSWPICWNWREREILAVKRFILLGYFLGPLLQEKTPASANTSAEWSELHDSKLGLVYPIWQRT